MKHTLFFRTLVTGILMTAPACMSLKNIQQTRIEGRLVEYATAGEGRPTIVLETGMGPDMGTWTLLFDSLSSLSTVYAYNRPGYGNSNLRNPPHSVREVAEQLHSNLKAIDLQPPYVLVGHSVGGLYVNMFARRYPGEVAGVVFLDSSHPDQFEYFRQYKPLLYNILMTSTTKGNRKYEEAIVKNTQADFSNPPPFPDVPIAVLTAGKKSSPLEGEEMRNQWLEFQNDLSALSQNSKHIIVENSGHYIHKDRPDVVLNEIARIIESSSRNQ